MHIVKDRHGNSFHAVAKSVFEVEMEGPVKLWEDNMPFCNLLPCKIVNWKANTFSLTECDLLPQIKEFIASLEPQKSYFEGISALGFYSEVVRRIQLNAQVSMDSEVMNDLSEFANAWLVRDKSNSWREMIKNPVVVFSETNGVKIITNSKTSKLPLAKVCQHTPLTL